MSWPNYLSLLSSQNFNSSFSIVALTFSKKDLPCFGKTCRISGVCIQLNCRFQWSHCLRRTFAASRPLRMWFRLPPGTSMLSVESVACY